MMHGDGGTEFARLGKTPAEQAAAMVRPFSVVAWTAAEIMHWAGMQGWQDLAVATAIASSLAWGASARGWVPSAMPAWIALAGGWAAAAWYFGPLAWLPAPMLTVIWVILLQSAHRAAHRHPAVADARQWRDARARWLMLRNDWGLGGAHLLDYQETYLGELYEVSTKGTGKRASQYIASRAHEEYIAEHENLPRGRVQIRGHELAGRILISIRRRDPWAKPLLHPIACDEHEIAIPERRSIMDPALVGQDPETGHPLEVPLYDRETGGKNIAVTGIKGAGKGVLLDDISEHVTACEDAIMIRVNVSIKGYAEAAAWGPSCHLTAFGPEQKSRAVAVMKVLNRIIEWRARTYRQGAYTPSPADPALVLFVDESDAAAAVPELKRELDTFATKAREYGGVYGHAGQRNTNDYHSAKQRSQDDVHCTGKVANANEMRHTGGLGGPDMATHGEGHAGVWAIRLLGGSASAGRTWVFAATKAAHGAMVAEIAAERAFTQPELPAACREYLGGKYEALLASEVFTKWAQDRDLDDFIPRDDEDWPQDTPAPARQDDGATAAMPALPAAGTATAVADPGADLEEMLRTPMDDDARARYASVRERLSAAAASLAETVAMPRPETDPADRAAYIAARWQQVTAGVQIPEGARPRLLEMLAEGTTIKAVADEFGLSRWTARTWLEKLRDSRLARVDGTGRGTKWRSAEAAGEAS